MIQYDWFHLKLESYYSNVLWKETVTARQRSCGKVMFSVVSVHHSVHGGGFPCDHYPWCIRHHCSGPYPPSQAPPPTILLAKIWWRSLVTCSNLFTWGPTSTSTYIWWPPKHVWFASGRYASYWNAFLFIVQLDFKKYVFCGSCFFVLLIICIYYRPQRSCGQGNIFAPVCHSVHRGVCLSACWDPPGSTPPEAPPGKHTPPGSTPPPTGSRLRHTVNERPVRMHSCFFFPFL